METFKRIFAAMDFSPGSDNAVREAHNRARANGGQLAVCHIVPNEMRNYVLFPHEARTAALQFPLEMRKIGDAAVARVAEITGRAESEYEFILDDGTPHSTILERAESWHADLIVMGSHGQTSGAGVLMGSVTDSVVRHAHCPVLIIRQGDAGECVLAGTDFSDTSTQALKVAAGEAERMGVPLVAVHSLDLIWSVAAYPAMAFGGTPFNISPERVAELSALAATRLDETLQRLNIRAEVMVTTGAAGPAILDAAADRRAGLIVVGTVGRTGLRRALLGSVAETIVENATCSTLVVRRRAV